MEGSSSSSESSNPNTTTPTQPPKQSLAQRYKPLWRLLLISNLALGAYMFTRVKKKDTGIEESKAAAKVPSSTAETTPPPVDEEPIFSPPVTEPVRIREPIPEDQQRELFKWILEEKRKVKPKDRAEKKKIDEEKAILKQFIRAESIPKI